MTLKCWSSPQMSKLRVGLCPSLTQSLLHKLHQNGVYSVSDFINKDLEDLAKRLDVACKDVTAMRRVLLAQFSALPVCAADLYDDLMKTVSILSSGCEDLDKILEGGFYTTEVSELVGELGAGKTQICLNVALTLALTTAQNVIWIDSCGSFDVGRLQQILEERELCEEEQEKVHKRIKVFNAFDAMQLLSSLEEIKLLLIHQGSCAEGSVKLIVVDSVTAVLSPLLSGYTPDGHSMMMQIGSLLKQIASEYSLAVLTTNNLVGGDTAQTKKPALGRAWSSMPNTRILLQRECVHRINPQAGGAQTTDNTTRIASIIRSNRLPEHLTTAFDIRDSGIINCPANNPS